MDKIAQELGLLKSLREKISLKDLLEDNSSEYALIKSKMIEVDTEVRDILLGKDSGISLKKQLKEADGLIKRREFLQALVSISKFCDVIENAKEKLKEVNYDLDKVHAEVLSKVLSDEDIEMLQRRKSSSRKEVLFKQAGILDAFHNIFSPRGRALRAWEKRHPNQARKFRTAITSLLNKSISLFNQILNSFKKMGSFRVSRRIEEYVKEAKSIYSKMEAYVTNFKNYFNQNFKKILDTLEMGAMGIPSETGTATTTPVSTEEGVAETEVKPGEAPSETTVPVSTTPKEVDLSTLKSEIEGELSALFSNKLSELSSKVDEKLNETAHLKGADILDSPEASNIVDRSADEITKKFHELLESIKPEQVENEEEFRNRFSRLNEIIEAMRNSISMMHAAKDANNKYDAAATIAEIKKQIGDIKNQISHISHMKVTPVKDGDKTTVVEPAKAPTDEPEDDSLPDTTTETIQDSDGQAIPMPESSLTKKPILLPESPLTKDKKDAIPMPESSLTKGKKEVDKQTNISANLAPAPKINTTNNLDMTNIQYYISHFAGKYTLEFLQAKDKADFVKTKVANDKQIILEIKNKLKNKIQILEKLGRDPSTYKQLLNTTFDNPVREFAELCRGCIEAEVEINKCFQSQEYYEKKFNDVIKHIVAAAVKSYMLKDNILDQAKSINFPVTSGLKGITRDNLNKFKTNENKDAVDQIIENLGKFLVSRKALSAAVLEGRKKTDEVYQEIASSQTTFRPDVENFIRSIEVWVQNPIIQQLSVPAKYVDIAKMWATGEGDDYNGLGSRIRGLRRRVGIGEYGDVDSPINVNNLVPLDF